MKKILGSTTALVALFLDGAASAHPGSDQVVPARGWSLVGAKTPSQERRQMAWFDDDNDDDRRGVDDRRNLDSGWPASGWTNSDRGEGRGSSNSSNNSSSNNSSNNSSSNSSSDD